MKVIFTNLVLLLMLTGLNSQNCVLKISEVGHELILNEILEDANSIFFSFKNNGYRGVILDGGQDGISFGLSSTSNISLKYANRSSQLSYPLPAIPDNTWFKFSITIQNGNSIKVTLHQDRYNTSQSVTYRSEVKFSNAQKFIKNNWAFNQSSYLLDDIEIGNDLSKISFCQQNLGNVIYDETNNYNATLQQGNGVLPEIISITSDETSGNCGKCINTALFINRFLDERFSVIDNGRKLKKMGNRGQYSLAYSGVYLPEQLTGSISFKAELTNQITFLGFNYGELSSMSKNIPYGIHLQQEGGSERNQMALYAMFEGEEIEKIGTVYKDDIITLSREFNNNIDRLSLLIWRINDKEIYRKENFITNCLYIEAGIYSDKGEMSPIYLSDSWSNDSQANPCFISN